MCCAWWCARPPQSFAARGRIFLLVCLLYKSVALQSYFSFWGSSPSECSFFFFFFKAEGEFCLEVAYRNLAPRCNGSERLIVLAKAECGICKHMWDIQALDAEVCDFIPGESAVKCLWAAASGFTRLKIGNETSSEPKC